MVESLDKRWIAIMLFSAAVTIGAVAVTLYSSDVFSEAQLLPNEQRIKITGEASQRIKPDQVTLSIAVQTQPSDVTTIADKQQKTVQDIINAIMSADGVTSSNTSVTIGNSYMNPVYVGTPSNIDSFSAYGQFQVITDVNNYSTIIEKVVAAGFRIESVNVNPAPQEEGKTDAPYQLNLYVAFDTSPDTLQNIIKAYQAQLEKLTSTLQDIGIPSDKMQPTNVYFNPIYYGYGGQGASKYTAYTQIIVKTDPNNVNNIMSAVAPKGAYIENFSFSVSDKQIEYVRKDLYQRAIENAKSRARKVAEAQGLKVTDIISLDASMPQNVAYGGIVPYRGVYFTQPYYDGYQGEISVSVTVEFGLAKL